MEKLLGIDVGSTTVKLTVVDPESSEVLYKSYERHLSFVRECTLKELYKIKEKFPDESFKASITGSAGLGLAEKCGISFVQEVQAAFIAIKKFYPDADVCVELGGEDAKIIFITGGTEQRMNGSCAGGTGSFIDQMATLLDISVDEMDELALGAKKVYPIASRCGVFAKSDIQPLINQGAEKADIADSIFHAVVEQTVAGLAQGRKIGGKVLFLGGPLHFLKSLRRAFVTTLGLDEEHAVFPENAPVFMSLGAALYSEEVKAEPLDSIIEKVEAATSHDSVIRTTPLFESTEEYRAFSERHSRTDLSKEDIKLYTGPAFLGIDSGSTTTKLILITPEGKILYSYYGVNNGQPLDTVVKVLTDIRAQAGDRVEIRSSAVTGYGEDMIKAALRVDFGIVETVAHFKAALHFNPNADFIIDIGGQDIKCFKVRAGAIDSIMLNEACSSGCGSFIQTFARAMNMDVEEFSKLGLFAKNPVELGSRCTVFMNSAVKQAQKEGAGIDDISAGLSSSIVKNAIYKVIRAKTPDELGENIVVQGGTFLNDAVLRSFELETGKNVIRPAIAGLMGAFGAALYAAENCHGMEKSSLLSLSELRDFKYTSRSANCGKCTSKCTINVLTFADGRKFISGNKCERGAGQHRVGKEFNLFDYKYKLLCSYAELGTSDENAVKNSTRGRVGLPLQLVMFEQMPLWSTFFRRLGFEVVPSERSSRDLYFKGQHTVASDTACYPAKLMHGHIESLLDAGVNFVFYPQESYNIDEHSSFNHYNCPVVAYYAELLKANNERLSDENLIMPYIDLNDEKTSVNALFKALAPYRVKKSEVKAALREGFKALSEYHAAVRARAAEIIEKARAEDKQIIVLAGRPYHADPEINHGIARLITSLGHAVVTEDAVFEDAPLVDVNVLNQWTYHSRLYRAAEYVSKNDDMNLVQLVSFGCGIDAITTDEMRLILEKNGKLYTQIKIDEINNLGVVKIRLRSMTAAIEEQRRRKNAE
ncbi:MAG: 2-hydroxyacyl-CoA dehydratase [Clostridia bacterium]|nr:2-hydroxyacyl-CoA dehydratase [Clostridia bacterium]